MVLGDSASLILRFLRVQQWYKNFVIFLALLFTKNLFNPPLLITTAWGFFALCLVSSAYYILNDIWDLPEDRLHPEKKNRPLTSGQISMRTAWAASLLCALSGLLLAGWLSGLFFVFVALLLVSGVVYTLGIRNVAVLDIHVIAFNFLLRAVSGAILIDVAVSPWLVFSIFFVALFLAAGKRESDLRFLEEKSHDKNVLAHLSSAKRKVYSVYTHPLLQSYVTLLAGVILFTYALYTFMEHNKPYPYMMATLPFVSFMVLRYLTFVFSGSPIARKTELVFTDKPMVTALVAWAASAYILLAHLY
ncbi:Protoheme IX farnesyltransferase [uncultured archaeon]|nr:Protoheme IX farnesyltransferase [uncultured archaeon]